MQMVRRSTVDVFSSTLNEAGPWKGGDQEDSVSSWVFLNDVSYSMLHRAKSFLAELLAAFSQCLQSKLAVIRNWEHWEPFSCSMFCKPNSLIFLQSSGCSRFAVSLRKALCFVFQVAVWATHAKVEPTWTQSILAETTLLEETGNCSLVPGCSWFCSCTWLNCCPALGTPTYSEALSDSDNKELFSDACRCRQSAQLNLKEHTDEFTSQLF